MGEDWGVAHSRLRKLEERHRNGELHSTFRAWCGLSDAAPAKHGGGGAYRNKAGRAHSDHRGPEIQGKGGSLKASGGGDFEYEKDNSLIYISQFFSPTNLPRVSGKSYFSS